MKKFKLLSLVGITSIALARAGWAGGHGGGGGGHGGGGGGGFHGGGFGGGGFRSGGAGTIHTDITVTTITRTITMDTAGTRTVTMVAAVMDTAMAADQGISEVSGVGDKPVRLFEIARPLMRVDQAGSIQRVVLTGE